MKLEYHSFRIQLLLIAQGHSGIEQRTAATFDYVRFCWRGFQIYEQPLADERIRRCRNKSSTTPSRGAFRPQPASLDSG